MTAVTSLGVGSGLDLQGMLTKLMAVEQQPITALQTKQASYQSRISALGTLASGLTALQTAAAALTPVSYTHLDVYKRQEAKFENGVFTGHFNTKNNNGVEKVNRIKKEIEGKKFDKIIAFGDTSGDKPMLSLAHESHYRFFH